MDPKRGEIWLVNLDPTIGAEIRKTRPCIVVSSDGLRKLPLRLVAPVTEWKPQFESNFWHVRISRGGLTGLSKVWWVAGPGWWLWVFTNPELTFYVVAQSRGRDLLNDVLGKDFGGVLVSDCLAIYDDATALQQKCYAHHHQAIRKAKDLHPHQGEGFLCEAAAMLRAAVALQEQKALLSLETFRDLRQALEHHAVQLLEPARSEPNEEAVRNRLNKQRDHLFTFLHHDGVDATNNLVERQLRPAVIARKISCGNKTIKGAQTWQILASLAANCTQRATSFIGALARAAPLQAR